MTSHFLSTALPPKPENKVLDCYPDTADMYLRLGRRDHRQMRKLDRVRWTAGVSFTIFGVGIGVRVNREEFLDPLLARVPIGWKSVQSSGIERLYSLVAVDVAGMRESASFLNVLFGDTQRLARTTNLTSLCEAFESDLEFYVGQKTRRYVFVHAGVVAWKRRAIVIPGRSHSGKTTLVRALLQEGASYYSDEFAVLDQEGRVHPFPKLLSVRANAGPEKIAAADLGAPTGRQSLPIGLVVITRYKANTCWKPNILSPGQGMLGLLQNTLSARLRPELAFETLAQAMSRASVLGGPRGEARETARFILKHLERESV